MTLDELKNIIPDVSANLSNLLIESALPALEGTDMTLDDVSPSVSITFIPKKGGPRVRFTLSVEQIAEGDTDEEEDEE